MSKPDSAGESLESILASIRKSLAEQSTVVLEEEAAAPADSQDDAASQSPRSDGLARRLAGTAAEAGEDDGAGLAGNATPDRVEEPVTSAPSPVVPAAARGQEDPLWFLSGHGRPAKESQQPATTDGAGPAAGDGKVPTAAPRIAKAGVVRGPLPPFFGSSAEAQKAEVVMVQPSPPGVGMVLPPGSRAPSGIEVQAADGVRNGKASSLFGRVADNRSTSEATTPHVHALEAVVLELLRPMLQRWLDENMPRLVSAALKDEAARMTARDSKKA